MTSEETQHYCASSRCSSKTHAFHLRLLTVLGTMELLHVAVLLTVLVNVYAEVPVSVGNPSIQVKQGEDALLSCDTKESILFCTFTSPTGEIFNMIPDLKYKQRYEFHGENTQEDCGIKITDVQDEDNGDWKCDITVKDESGSAKKGEGQANVLVIKAPTAVSIAEGSEMVLTLPQDETKQVTCLAEGGRPRPTFSWMLRTEGKGEEAGSEEAYNGAVEDVEGGQVITYTTQPEDHGKFLVCVVNHAGFGEEAITQGLNKVEVKLDIRFKPVATSKSHKVWSMKLGESFDILLGFKAHPEPTELYWEMHDGTTVAQGSSNGRYTSALLIAGPHEGHFTAKLTIDKVLKEDGETTNKLIVKNTLGETTYDFVMGIGERPPPVEKGSGPVIAIVIVALIIVIVIVVAVVARAQGVLCFADPPKEEDKEKAVEKEEGSDTESAEAADGAKDEKDAEAATPETSDEEPVINNNTTKKSVTARFSGILSAMKKTVSKKEKYAETESEVKLQESEEKKDGAEDAAEKKDDSIVYADLDKSAMSEGKRPSITVENEKSEYAEISPQAKE